MVSISLDSSRVSFISYFYILNSPPLYTVTPFYLDLEDIAEVLLQKRSLTCTGTVYLFPLWQSIALVVFDHLFDGVVTITRGYGFCERSIKMLKVPWHIFMN